MPQRRCSERSIVAQNELQSLTSNKYIREEYLLNIDVIILFFGLGAFAGLVRADLRLPTGLYESLSLYLLLALGLKGGIELAQFGQHCRALWFGERGHVCRGYRVSG
jgi:Na+-dependent bicarbonate transporter superfamily